MCFIEHFGRRVHVADAKKAVELTDHVAEAKAALVANGAARYQQLLRTNGHVWSNQFKEGDLPGSGWARLESRSADERVLLRAAEISSSRTGCHTKPSGSSKHSRTEP
jgi:hypothetical protein